MCILPGRRTIAAAPYALHCSPEAWSFAGSHAWRRFPAFRVQWNGFSIALRRHGHSRAPILRYQRNPISGEIHGSGCSRCRRRSGWWSETRRRPCAETVAAVALNSRGTHHDAPFLLIRILKNNPPGTAEKYVGSIIASHALQYQFRKSLIQRVLTYLYDYEGWRLRAMQVGLR